MEIGIQTHTPFMSILDALVGESALAQKYKKVSQPVRIFKYGYQMSIIFFGTKCVKIGFLFLSTFGIFKL